MTVAMVSQAERDFRKLFTGNTAYYLDVEQYRSRNFLNRNIRTVLSSHERRRGPQDPVHRKMNVDSDGMVDTAESEKPRLVSHPRHTLRTRWSVDELCKGLRDGSISPQRAMLKVEPKALKRRAPSAANHATLSERPSKKLKHQDIRCYCGLTIWGPESPDETPLVKKSQECTVKTAITQTGEVLARIEIDEPIVIKAGELYVSVRRSGYSKMTIAQSYYMELMLMPLDSRDVWPSVLVKPIKNHHNAEADTTTAESMGSDQVLVANWTKLPNCPPKGALLSVQALKNRKPYKANISLEVDAAWCQSSTPLENYNSSLRVTPADRFPTPDSEPEKPTHTVTVIWTLGSMPSDEQKTLTLTGYLCPACQRRDFVNFDLLQFHLLTGHDLFKFQLTRDEENETLGTHRTVRISISVTDDYRNKAANHVKDDRVFCWERPRRSFNMRSFLAGDESWLGKLDRPSQTSLPRQYLQTSNSQSQDSSSWASQIVDPSTVLDVPLPRRKEHCVPRAPAEVTFFRASTKRPLEEGELVTESDDDVEEAWFGHKHEELINNLVNVRPTEKQFVKRYDTYMLKEDVSGNSHLANALIRFCRINKDWLAGPDMYKEFLKNAASLILHGSITEAVLQGCMRTIQGSRATKASPKKDRRKRGRRTTLSDEVDSDNAEEAVTTRAGQSDVEMLDAYQAIDKNSVLDLQAAKPSTKYVGNGLSYSMCKCGEKVKDLRAAIICADLVSLKPIPYRVLFSLCLCTLVPEIEND